MQWESSLERLINKIPDEITANEIVKKTIRFIKQREKPQSKIKYVLKMLENIYQSKNDGPFKSDPQILFESLCQVVRQNEILLKEYFQKLSYKDYLKTTYWKIISNYKKWESGYKCILCNNSDHLETHHKSYNIRGFEHFNLKDLTVLCHKCHENHSKMQLKEKKK